MKDHGIVKTEGDFNRIIGDWITIKIRTDYVPGCKSFTATYDNQKVTIKSDNKKTIDSCALHCRALSWEAFMRTKY